MAGRSCADSYPKKMNHPRPHPPTSRLWSNNNQGATTWSGAARDQLLAAVSLCLWVPALLLANPAPHAQEEVSAVLEPEATIVLEEPETGIGRVGEICVPGAEHIILLDFATTRILVFRHDGSFVRQIGSQGTHPGQFQQLYAVDARGPLIAAFDQSLARITIMDTTGAVLSHFSTAADTSATFGNRVKFTSAGTLIHAQAPKHWGERSEAGNRLVYEWTMAEYTLDGELLGYHGPFDSKRVSNTAGSYHEGSPEFEITENGRLFYCLQGYPAIFELDAGRSLLRVIPVTTGVTRLKQRLSSPPATGMLNWLRESVSDFSVMSSIEVLEDRDLLMTLQLLTQVDESGSPLAGQTRTYYLSVYDLAADEFLIMDHQLPQEGAGPRTMSITTGPGGGVFVVEDDRPNRFTVRKYRVSRILSRSPGAE